MLADKGGTMYELLTQVGVGGIIAFLIIDRVLPAKKKNGNGAGDSIARQNRDSIARCEAILNLLSQNAVRQTTLLEIMTKKGNRG